MKWRFDRFYLVITSFSVCNVGNYAVMTILVIYFIQSLNLSAAQAGALFLFTSLSFRLSRLFLGPLAERFPMRLAMVLALLLTSAGYLGLIFIKTPLLVVFLLFIIGTGHSTNGLLVKVVAAQTTDKGSSKRSPFLRYASLATGVNLAAAIGSSLGGTLFFHWGPASVFSVAAITYILSAVFTAGIPIVETGRSERLHVSSALRRTLKEPAIWRAMLFTLLAWFLYTQSYASLPLFVSEAVHRPDLLSSAFTLNAVLVIAGQLPISKAAIHFRLSTSQLAVLGFLAFAGGFALLWIFPGWPIVYTAVTFWTLGEMLLMPALDTLIAEGTLAEYRQTAFAVATIAVATGEGLGNLFGVSLGGFLLKSGSFSTLYTILTSVAIGATITAVFVVKRQESIVFRLLRGQSPVPTGKTQLLHPQPEPMERADLEQSLLTWLNAGSYHDEFSFFEAHPELIALDIRQLEHFIEQQPTESGREMLADRLNILRGIRSRVAVFVRLVNMYGGLILDLPKWLEEIKQQLANMDKEREIPARTASWRMARLSAAILRARSERSIAAAIIAELQVLYAIAALEDYGPSHAEALGSAIASLREALNVYTLAQYPYQYARTQAFLSMAYQDRVKANLEQALACYQAAVQGYKSGPFPWQVVATEGTGSNTYSRSMVEGKLAELEQAMTYCRMALQNVIELENRANELTQGLRSLPEDFDPDKTLIIRSGASKARLAHIKWLASQTTQRLSAKDLVHLEPLKQENEK